MTDCFKKGALHELLSVFLFDKTRETDFFGPPYLRLL